MTLSGTALAAERTERIRSAVRFAPVDRVPLALSVGCLAAYQKSTMARFVADPEAALVAVLDTLDDLDAAGGLDGSSIAVAGSMPIHQTDLSMAHVNAPGFELADDQLWQVVEREVMTVDDYDFILENGWKAFWDVHMAKVYNPELLRAHGMWFAQHGSTMAARYAERGYAVMASSVTLIPFDAMAGARSMTRFFRDCYRTPEKIREVSDVALDFFVERSAIVADLSGLRGCWISAARTASSMVSPKIWNELVWPYYVRLVQALHERDILVVLHFDSSWERDLHRFLELPRQSCVFAGDGGTDLRKAREVFGDHLALFGDVPSTLLATGEPGDVRRYVRDQIRDLGSAGLIMSQGCEIPFNTPWENVVALVEANAEFGAC